MKRTLVLAFIFVFVISCWALSDPVNQSTSSKPESTSSSLTRRLFFSFLNISLGIVGLYYWGLSRSNKSWASTVRPSSDAVEVLDSELWYIHGKAYDLAGFMSRHPGGYRPLMMAKGRDCTELFESYHSLTDAPRELLKKFEVPAKNLKNYQSTFNWDMNSKANAFQKELREIVRTQVKKNRDLMCPPDIQIGCLLFTALTAWMTVKYYWAGEWWASIVVPTMWWISFIQTFHDATHFAFSKNELVSSFWVYLYPYFSSPTTWDHQHVIGHHIWTNIFKKDPDLNHGMPAFRIHPRFSYRPWFRFQMFWVWLVWSVSTFYLSIVYDWTGFTTGVYHGILPYQKLSPVRMAAHLFGRAVSVFLTCGIPFVLFPFWQALYWSVSFYAIWGFFFMLVTQINHITEECFEGAVKPDECWAIHQVKTAHDFSHGSFLWWLLSGGLNYQIEHHLFPGVNSNHLPEIAPIVQNLCKKHNIPYNYSENYIQAIAKYLKMVVKGSLKTVKN